MLKSLVPVLRGLPNPSQKNEVNVSKVSSSFYELVYSKQDLGNFLNLLNLNGLSLILIELSEVLKDFEGKKTGMFNRGVKFIEIFLKSFYRSKIVFHWEF